MADTKCFISYARQDVEFARKITRDLRRRRFDIFFDVDSISPGTDYDWMMENMLNKADVMLFLASPNSVKSNHVLDELSFATNKDKQILILLIEPCELPLRYSRTQSLDMINDYERGLEILVETLERKRGDIELIEENLPPLNNISKLPPSNNIDINESPNIKTENNLSDLNATAFAPEKVKPGNSFLVQVFAHDTKTIEEIKRIALVSDEDAIYRGSSTLSYSVNLSQELGFSLSIPGLIIDEAVQTAVWTGKLIHIQYGVTVPKDHLAADVIATVVISQASLPIGSLRFKIKIISAQATEDVKSNQLPVDFTPYRQAFVSYCAKDRTEVLKRVQMLKASRINYFTDLLSLDAGQEWEKEIYLYIDKSDVVFLFWSTSAKNSNGVKQEIDYALNLIKSRKSFSPNIIPILIEGPPVPTPPAQLRHLHFNDVILYLKDSEIPSLPNGMIQRIKNIFKRR